MKYIIGPWPWYLVGPLIGLTVPLLLIIGNKSFGVSSSLRHICASVLPVKIPFFKYEWKKEKWNLFFVAGILLGGVVAATFLSSPNDVVVNPKLAEQLAAVGITDYSNLVPLDIISWKTLFTVKGLFFTVIGGFLVGFGTRYAGGCTSGHSIMGLSNMQFPSLVATIFFMIGGFIMANLILPFILSL